jgi:hypothetical protein
MDYPNLINFWTTRYLFYHRGDAGLSLIQADSPIKCRGRYLIVPSKKFYHQDLDLFLGSHGSLLLKGICSDLNGVHWEKYIVRSDHLRMAAVNVFRDIAEDISGRLSLFNRRLRMSE